MSESILEAEDTLQLMRRMDAGVAHMSVEHQQSLDEEVVVDVEGRGDEGVSEVFARRNVAGVDGRLTEYALLMSIMADPARCNDRALRARLHDQQFAFDGVSVMLRYVGRALGLDRGHRSIPDMVAEAMRTVGWAGIQDAQAALLDAHERQDTVIGFPVPQVGMPHSELAAGGAGKALFSGDTVPLADKLILCATRSISTSTEQRWWRALSSESARREKQEYETAERRLPELRERIRASVRGAGTEVEARMRYTLTTETLRDGLEALFGRAQVQGDLDLAVDWCEHPSSRTPPVGRTVSKVYMLCDPSLWTSAADPGGPPHSRFAAALGMPEAARDRLEAEIRKLAPYDDYESTLFYVRTMKMRMFVAARVKLDDPELWGPSGSVPMGTQRKLCWLLNLYGVVFLVQMVEWGWWRAVEQEARPKGASARSSVLRWKLEAQREQREGAQYACAAVVVAASKRDEGGGGHLPVLLETFRAELAKCDEVTSDAFVAVAAATLVPRLYYLPILEDVSVTPLQLTPAAAAGLLRDCAGGRDGARATLLLPARFSSDKTLLALLLFECDTSVTHDAKVGAVREVLSHEEPLRQKTKREQLLSGILQKLNLKEPSRAFHAVPLDEYEQCPQLVRDVRRWLRSKGKKDADEWLRNIFYLDHLSSRHLLLHLGEYFDVAARARPRGGTVEFEGVTCDASGQPIRDVVYHRPGRDLCSDEYKKLPDKKKSTFVRIDGRPPKALPDVLADVLPVYMSFLSGDLVNEPDIQKKLQELQQLLSVKDIEWFMPLSDAERSDGVDDVVDADDDSDDDADDDSDDDSDDGLDDGLDDDSDGRFFDREALEDDESESDELDDD